MTITIVLLILAIALFACSLVMIGRAKSALNFHEESVRILQKSIDDNFDLSKNLYNFYSALQENQNLQIKAVEMVSKHQKLTVSDLNELREQVSNALVAIVQQISSGGGGLDNIKFKVDGKIKLN